MKYIFSQKTFNSQDLSLILDSVFTYTKDIIFPKPENYQKDIRFSGNFNCESATNGISDVNK